MVHRRSLSGYSEGTDQSGYPENQRETQQLDEPAADLRLFGLRGLPEVEPGTDLARLILEAAAPSALRDRDVLVVAQKVVSKAEGRLLDLRSVEPSP